ncbi:Iron-containing redox enzyme [Noviherbaspirillum humi]|uniref:Iron-containing redox enzyme n=1 Tax=Noviherbaspirillum humi TaxID=1688639 RepID=A0A239LR53_9BURK|nr:iron-containing redox enzyme family protein [Noviherbaspirillum humi]SNT32358.1 Iron-containing redox enzyme [Noviherbaspirillum humi]
MTQIAVKEVVHYSQPETVTDRQIDSKTLYFQLDGSPDDAALAEGADYLRRQLAQARDLECDLPAEPAGIQAWIEANTRQVGQQYAAYLEARKAGAPRRYFGSKAHALYFLQSVAPTKLVDGSWLYGLVARWREARFAPLIRIYLEELGEGVPDKNHVAIYRRLLDTHGCTRWQDLDDSRFVQGAIQLALAHHAADFLPEVIGFNLGYEQLPLHLLITSYELNELGIDPYYFTLHVTVDNAASGHARMAMQGLLDALPRAADGAEFYRRVRDGYRLNMLGAGTTSVIADFDLERELLHVLASKCAVGSYMHSNYCRIGGKSVNQWLADPAQLPGFLDAMQQAGWIRRHAHPEQSRFWKLIQGEHAEMFGVFNAYERQVIHDWIAGDSLHGARNRPLSYKAKRRLLDAPEPEPRAEAHAGAPRGVLRRHPSPPGQTPQGADDFSRELRELEDRLASLPGRDAMMDMLSPLLAPSLHHSAAGMMATRIYARLLDQA